MALKNLNLSSFICIDSERYIYTLVFSIYKKAM